MMTLENGSNLLSIEYIDIDGTKKNITINNNFENQGFFEKLFRKDTIDTSYNNDRSLENLFDTIRDEYEKAGGDPYKEAPIAQRYLNKLHDLFDSNLNLAAKDFVFTHRNGLLEIFNGQNSVSSKVPEDYEKRLDQYDKSENDLGRD